MRRPDEVRFIIRDEGPGFDVTTLPDISQPETIELESGQGLPLMRALMDEVTYNKVGNEVTMVKRRKEASERIDSAPV